VQQHSSHLANQLHAPPLHAHPIDTPGTGLRYKPGIIVCGGGLVHDCGGSRGIGYFLEALVLLGLYAKKVSCEELLRAAVVVHLEACVPA
jgi:hypothetical protein